MVEKKEVQTSVHEVPRDAKDDSKDSNASRDVLLVPTVEEVINFENFGDYSPLLHSQSTILYKNVILKKKKKPCLFLTKITEKAIPTS